jgi:Fe-S cluster assembly protein SufD
LLGRGDVQLSKNAHFGGMNASYGAAITRDDLMVRLHGPGGHSHISAVFAPRNGQTVDNHTTVDHIAPDCTSDQLYKGVLDGSGHGIFNGRIFVRQLAQRTAAEQMNRNLILSADARIDTKPQLEIFADDVRCTHGATIGQLDREELFYLMSRAIPRETARRLVIQGFADEVFERTDDARIAALLSERFTAHMMG